MTLGWVFRARRAATVELFRTLKEVVDFFRTELKQPDLELVDAQELRGQVTLIFSGDKVLEIPLNVLDDSLDAIAAWWKTTRVALETKKDAEEAAFMRWQIDTLQTLIERRERELESSQQELAAMKNCYLNRWGELR